MAEEDTVTVNIIQCMFTEEYGSMDAHKDYEVRADLAERWISEGKALPAAEKKS